MTPGRGTYFSCILLATAVILSLNFGVLQENIETIPEQEEICCVESMSSESEVSRTEIPPMRAKSFHYCHNITYKPMPGSPDHTGKAYHILYCTFRE